MAKPSEKAPGMESMLDNITESMYGRKRTTSIEGDICVTCGAKAPPESFTDALSKKEYAISGMCQSCQDKTFRPPDEDEEDHPDCPDEPAF